MNALTHFNVRVYGILIHEGHLLVNEEVIKGLRVIKFPGGGLELGEGLIDGLKREWNEELNMEIEVLQHFYTTDFFQKSAFDNSQVISVYYRVGADCSHPLCNTHKNERTYWMPLEEVNEHTFTLPIDRLVGKMLAAGI